MLDLTYSQLCTGEGSKCFSSGCYSPIDNRLSAIADCIRSLQVGSLGKRIQITPRQFRDAANLIIVQNNSGQSMAALKSSQGKKAHAGH
ncbi:MAG: hypothetical protein KAW46_05505, partial [candidate division Zixibacteria bacterium]|nr:hypothetical protein [candidate division Zixibacteria bacterium]